MNYIQLLITLRLWVAGPPVSKVDRQYYIWSVLIWSIAGVRFKYERNGRNKFKQPKCTAQLQQAVWASRLNPRYAFLKVRKKFVHHQSISEHQWNTTGIRVCVYIPWNISIHSSKLQFLSPGRGTSVSPNVTPPSTPRNEIADSSSRSASDRQQ